MRPGSAAASAGVNAGDEIDTINDLPVARAAAEFEPTFVRAGDPAAREWALQVALAGRHDQPEIRLALRSAAVPPRTVTYAPAWPQPAQPLSVALHGRVAHLRINNALGDIALIEAFDSALATLPGARALVIDLRDTPSGGTSEVARGIIGRVIAHERPYQRHELIEESRHAGIRRIWVEQVVPRGPVFRGPVVVLVGRWTGSMGEGLAIGLNAARAAPVWGQPMAHLLGALGEFTLPNSGIVVRVPVERLFHVDGRPREAFVPCRVGAPASSAGDAELATAINLARKMLRHEGPMDGGRCGGA